MQLALIYLFLAVFFNTGNMTTLQNSALEVFTSLVGRNFKENLYGIGA